MILQHERSKEVPYEQFVSPTPNEELIAPGWLYQHPRTINTPPSKNKLVKWNSQLLEGKISQFIDKTPKFFRGTRI